MSSQPNAEIILKNATNVVKEIKHSNILSATFLEIQKSEPPREHILTTLKLPAQTRWGSSLTCLQSLCDNRFNLKGLAISKVNDRLDQLTKKNILDDDFWFIIKMLIEILTPIVVCLKKVEEDDSKVSELPEIFLELRTHLSSKFKESLCLLTTSEANHIIDALKLRSDMAVTPLHFTANILDPSLKGRNLNTSEVALGSEIIRRVGRKFKIPEDKLLIQLVEYNSELGIWNNDYIKQSATLVNAINWWKGACMTSVLSKVAIAILGFACTSAATERYIWLDPFVEKKSFKSCSG